MVLMRCSSYAGLSRVLDALSNFSMHTVTAARQLQQQWLREARALHSTEAYWNKAFSTSSNMHAAMLAQTAADAADLLEQNFHFTNAAGK